jgi:hypothetical protein
MKGNLVCRARWMLALILTQLHLSSSTLPAYSQPAPIFHVGCGELRDAIARHGIDGSELTTIRVEGRITAIDDIGSVVFVLICDLPDPRVLCVTYGTNGNQVGDRVVVGGGFGPQDPDHIMLDPCLHGSPEQYRD